MSCENHDGWIENSSISLWTKWIKLHRPSHTFFVAGMEAARTSALRGYKVILFEKSDHLGGHIVEAGAHSFKSEIAKLCAW